MERGIIRRIFMFYFSLSEIDLKNVGRRLLITIKIQKPWRHHVTTEYKYQNL